VKPTRFVPCTASHRGALEPDLGGVALRFSPREFHSSPRTPTAGRCSHWPMPSAPRIWPR